MSLRWNKQKIILLFLSKWLFKCVAFSTRRERIVVLDSSLPVGEEQDLRRLIASSWRALSIWRRVWSRSLENLTLPPLSPNGASPLAFPALLVPMVPWAHDPSCYLGDWPLFVFRFWTLLPRVISRGALWVGFIISTVVPNPFLLMSPPALPSMVYPRTRLERQRGLTNRQLWGSWSRTGRRWGARVPWAVGCLLLPESSCQPSS